jgi:hypothetical protein
VPLDQTSEYYTDAADSVLRQAIMTAFCSVMRDTGLPPMTIMRLAASVVGSIYREVSDAHSGRNACPCGWQPCPHHDLDVLKMALAVAAETPPFPDLRRMRAAGQA